MADETKTPVVEDIELSDFGSNGGTQDWDTAPEDNYTLELIGWETVAKPPHKIESEAARNATEGKTKQIDPQQWQITFKIADSEWDGITIKTWVNRTFHENSTAGKIAAALAGLEKYDRSAMIDAGYGSIKTLFGKRCKGDVVEKEKDGITRNYINGFKRLPPVRARGQRATAPVAEDGLGLEEEAF
jgi:hypothetical protein